ncbi:MAG TPA: hypothetical protein VK968_20185, partial [Roseimicrobium sp.]|nr:hypothetical protein [Roseimicrobium sp.]
PGHPDVRAMMVALGQGGGNFDQPPMLVPSWRIAVDHGLIPPTSPSADVARGLIGSGPWLTWRPTESIYTMATPAVAPSGLNPTELIERLKTTPIRARSSMSPVAQRAVNVLSSNMDVMLQETGPLLTATEELTQFAQKLMVPVETAAEALEEAYKASIAPTP